MGAAASEAKLLLKTGAAFNWLLRGSVLGPELGRETAGAHWLCKGSVQGPELGRKTEGETCKDTGESAGYWYEHVRASNRTPRSDRHSRGLATESLPQASPARCTAAMRFRLVTGCCWGLAMEVRSAMNAVAAPFRAGTWNSEQGIMRCPAVPRTSSLATEPGGNFSE